MQNSDKYKADRFCYICKTKTQDKAKSKIKQKQDFAKSFFPKHKKTQKTTTKDNNER
ncbi:hypothetical protein [Helicobacter sp. T3_23-1056]